MEQSSPENPRFVIQESRSEQFPTHASVCPSIPSPFDLLVIERIVGAHAAIDQGLTSRLQKAKDALPIALAKAAAELIPYGVTACMRALLSVSSAGASVSVKRVGLSHLKRLANSVA